MSIPSSQAPVAGRGCPSGPSRQPRQRRALCSGSRRSCSVAVHSFLGPGGSLNRSLLSILSPAAVPPQELEIVAKPSLDPLDSELGWRNGLNKAYSIGAVIGTGAHGKVRLRSAVTVRVRYLPQPSHIRADALRRAHAWHRAGLHRPRQAEVRVVGVVGV